MFTSENTPKHRKSLSILAPMSDQQWMKPSEFFSVPLLRLEADKLIPFPIYMFLRLNNRYVMLCKVNSSLGASRYSVYASKLKEVYIPEAYREAYFDYIRENEPETFRQLSKSEAVTTTPDFSEHLHEETVIARDVYSSSYLSTKAKTEILSNLAGSLLNSFSSLDSTSEEERKEAMSKCTQIADEIIMLACLSSDVYDEIISIRNAKEAIDHSVATSTLAILFAMTVGIVDEITLGDLATAALFHDIGLKDIPIDVIDKPEFALTEDEHSTYMNHINHSIKFIQLYFPKANSRVLELVQDHHENYDGTGFPRQKSGLQISELAQVLRLADWFDHLVTGKITGELTSPQWALQQIYATLRDPEEATVIQPELLERIFQAIFDGRVDAGSSSIPA